MLCVCLKVGIVVNCEDLFSDSHWRVCQAFATFVTQRTMGGKVRFDWGHSVWKNVDERIQMVCKS